MKKTLTVQIDHELPETLVAVQQGFTPDDLVCICETIQRNLNREIWPGELVVVGVMILDEPAGKNTFVIGNPTLSSNTHLNQKEQE